MSSHRAAHLTLVALVVASLGIAGCSGAGDNGAAPPAASPTLSSAVSSPALWAPPGSAALSSSTTDALQAAIDAWVDQGHLTGMTAAVVTPDGVWSGAAGVDAAGTPLQADSALSIMSISKTYTAAEVMLLASRGLIDLDAPITDYVAVPFETRGATVRQVLGMRSGLPSTSTEADQTAQAADLDREWTVSEALATLPEDAPRLGELGGEPRYNSTNYQLLAELVAAVTHRPYAEALRADLLDPVGLQRTWVQPAETPTGPLTVGGRAPYADIVDPNGPFMPSRSFASFALGAGNLAADALDSARWGYLLYGGQVIDSTLVSQMEADPQPDPDIGLYALGTTVMTDEQGVTMVGHAGGGPDLPYTSAMNVWTGDLPVAVAVLTAQPVDHGTGIFEVFMRLHSIVAG